MNLFVILYHFLYSVSHFFSKIHRVYNSHRLPIIQKKLLQLEIWYHLYLYQSSSLIRRYYTLTTMQWLGGYVWQCVVVYSYLNLFNRLTMPSNSNNIFKILIIEVIFSYSPCNLVFARLQYFQFYQKQD
jgi:hypothetical protein